MKYSQFRALLFTFALGLASVSFFNYSYNYFTEIPVDLPQTEFNTVLPVYVEMPGKPFNISYGAGGGGASGGRTCEEFIKSLGKLTKKTRRIIEESPCRDEIQK